MNHFLIKHLAHAMKVVVYVHVGNAARAQQVRHLIRRSLLPNKDIQVDFFV